MPENTKSISWAVLTVAGDLWPQGTAGKLQLSIPCHGTFPSANVSWGSGQEAKAHWKNALKSIMYFEKPEKKETPHGNSSNMRGQLARS